MLIAHRVIIYRHDKELSRKDRGADTHETARTAFSCRRLPGGAEEDGDA